MCSSAAHWLGRPRRVYEGRRVLNANDKFMYKLQRAKVPLTNPYKRNECVCVCVCGVQWHDATRRLGVCFMNRAHKVQSMNRAGSGKHRKRGRERGSGRGRGRASGPLRLAWALTISTPALIIIKGAVSKGRRLARFPSTPLSLVPPPH